MKNNIVIILLLVSVLSNSQTIRFIYDVSYKADSASAVTTKENYHLDINNNHIDYYNRDYFVADSLIANKIEFPKDLKLNTSNLISHFKGNNLYNDYDLLESIVLNVISKENQIWTLENVTRKFNDLTLQKANAIWGGRKWVAWFTKDIPIQEGPYKFRGLPGLIVEIEDTKGNYKFSLAKSENVKIYKNQFLEEMKKASIPVSENEYKKTKLSYYQSPVGFIKNGLGITNSTQFFLNDGTVVTSSNMRAINEQLRNKIKKYNNPIDLTKAINY